MSFHNEKIVVGRKLHTCELCGQPIDVGTRHVSAAGRSGYGFYDWRAHLGCLALVVYGWEVGSTDCEERELRYDACYELAVGVPLDELLAGVRKHAAEPLSAAEEDRVRWWWRQANEEDEAPPVCGCGGDPACCGAVASW